MSDLGIHLVVLEVTDRCNLKCIHCYNDGSQGKDISHEDFEIVIKELKKVKPYYVTLSGGEPLLLGKWLFNIAEALRDICKKLLLTTNGLLITKFPAQSFRIFDNVQISLDGPKDVHEKIRGKGTFERTLNAAKYLKDAGVNITFNMTIHVLNKDYLVETYEIARSLGIQLGIERMSTVGRGKDITRISANEWKYLLKIATEKKINCRDPLSFAFRKGIIIKPNKICGGCTAGIASLVITPSLEIIPCVRLRIPVGNLKSRNLREIWLNSDIFNKLRDRASFEKCGTCYYRNICGGCRAEAYAETGNYLGPDPLCWF